MERAPIIFAEGLTWERPLPNAPELLRGKLYIKVKDFVEFCEAHKNERGYVNLGLWKSVKNPEKLYFSLDQWKPKTSDSWTDDRLETPRNDRTPDPDKTYRSSLEGVVDYPIHEGDTPF